MNTNAVVYGAGNIGRGFIGMLFSQSGYHVTFIDISPELVEALRTRGSYPVRAIGGAETVVTNITALSGRDLDATAEAIANAGIMAVSVGAKALKLIAPSIAEGLRRRFARTDAPLDILLCENLLDAAGDLRGYLAQSMTPSELAVLDERVGLVEVSIGRAVPIQTPEMMDGDPLRLCVEKYAYLPADKDAFKGALPNIVGMVPHSPFGYYMERKLFIHNLGHAVCAYLGAYVGHAMMSEALADAEIQLMARMAMEESMRALSKKYGSDPLDILNYIDNLLPRFGCAELGDTCARVGNDPMRKLKPDDRLIGGARACEAQGLTPAFIAVGAAGALHQYLADADAAAEDALQALSGVSKDEPLGVMILELQALMAAHAKLSDIRAKAQSFRDAAMPDVI